MYTLYAREPHVDGPLSWATISEEKCSVETGLTGAVAMALESEIQADCYNALSSLSGSLGTRPSKNWKGGSDELARVEVSAVEGFEF